MNRKILFGSIFAAIMILLLPLNVAADSNRFDMVDEDGPTEGFLDDLEDWQMLFYGLVFVCIHFPIMMKGILTESGMGIILKIIYACAETFGVGCAGYVGFSEAFDIKDLDGSGL